jgi:hypothetical protein
MRSTRRLCLILLFTFVPVLTASAQTPDKGLYAASANVGVLFPDEALESTLTFDGTGEYYLSPRVSVRGLLGWANPGFENRTEDHFRQVKLLFNGVYNWEMGVWHPYATAGAGFYFVRQVLDGEDDPDSETRGGINFGGGIEYFANRMTTIKGELRWDVVSDPPGQPDATGFTFTVGVKRYF